MEARLPENHDSCNVEFNFIWNSSRFWCWMGRKWWRRRQFRLESFDLHVQVRLFWNKWNMAQFNALKFWQKDLQVGIPLSSIIILFYQRFHKNSLLTQNAERLYHKNSNNLRLNHLQASQNFNRQWRNICTHAFCSRKTFLFKNNNIFGCLCKENLVKRATKLHSQLCFRENISFLLGISMRIE